MLDLAWLQSFVRERVLPSEEDSFDHPRFDLSLYEELHAKGILQLALPRNFSGREASVVELAQVIRELGYGSLSVATTVIGNLLGQSAVILHGTPELRARVLADSQFCLWSMAMSEAEVGSDLAKTRTTAQEIAGGYLLTGEKNYITNASHSTRLTVYARVIDRFGKDRGLTAFYLDGSAAGLTRGAKHNKICARNADTATLHFDKVFVPHENVLGPIGEGLRILGHSLNRTKTLFAAIGIGMANRALDITQDRLLKTERFDRALIEQPMIRHALARLHTQVEAGWLLVDRAAKTWDAGERSTLAASQAKLFCGETTVLVVNKCAELFGSRGLFTEYEISRLLRDAKLLEIIEGPSYLQELMIAKEILPKKRRDNVTEISRIHSRKGSAA